MRTCARCRTAIPQGRLDALPDTHTCVTCSGVQKYVGAMIYDHKTAGRLEFLRPENTEAIRTMSRFVNRGR